MTNKTVSLETPLDLGDRKLEELLLRKPTAGDLRGVSMLQLQRWDTDECLKVVGRINLNQVTVGDLEKLEPYDLAALISQVATFFISPKAILAATLEATSKAS